MSVAEAVRRELDRNAAVFRPDPAAADPPSPASPVPRDAGAAWPTPPGLAAYHGLAGDVVAAFLPHTESDPVAVLLQFLAAFGNAVGRGPHFPVEGDRHPTNLNVALVGATAKGRKGTSWGRVRQLLELAEPGWAAERVAHGLSSGEGLIWQVRDPIDRPERDRRTGAVEIVTVDHGVADKRLFVLEAELAGVLRVMQRDGNTLSAVVRQAWDGGDLRALTKNSPARATGALVSVVGHITADELRRYLDRTESGNGFANRFLFACIRRSRCLPDGGGAVDLGGLAGSVRDALAAARGIGPVGRDAEARRLWHAVYPELSEGRPGLLGAVTARAEAQVTRLALLYALLDRRGTVGVAHLRAALELWRYCADSARWVFGDSQGDPVADTVLAALRTSPDGLSRTEMSQLFDRHVSGAQLGRALAALEGQGLVAGRRVGTGGRPREVWALARDGRSERSEVSEGRGVEGGFLRFPRFFRGPRPGAGPRAGRVRATPSSRPRTGGRCRTARCCRRGARSAWTSRAGGARPGGRRREGAGADRPPGRRLPGTARGGRAPAPHEAEAADTRRHPRARSGPPRPRRSPTGPSR
jgi:DNA-binding transcriptional ArsR family regulator